MRATGFVLAVALVLALAVAGGAVGTTGVSSVAADRTIDVRVATPAEAFLGVELAVGRPDANGSAAGAATGQGGGANGTVGPDGADDAVLRLVLENDLPGRPVVLVSVWVGDEHRRAFVPPADPVDERRFVVRTDCDAHLRVRAVGPDVRVAFERPIPCSASP